MIQLDKVGYKVVEDALQQLEVPVNGPSRLSIYSHAKDVLINGCRAVGTEEICQKCAGLLMPMCTTIVEITKR